MRDRQIVSGFRGVKIIRRAGFRPGASSLGVLGLVVISVGTLVVGPGWSLAGRTQASAQPLLATSPGTLIGPSRVKSVSFLVLLRSVARPTCFERWADSSRLSVKWAVGQDWATVSGAPRYVGAAFGVAINNYRSSTGVVFAANHAAAVPSGVCGEVAGVGTIHSFVQPTTFGVPAGGLSSVDMLRAYDALPLRNQGYAGQGETVVFMEGGGFLQSDFNKFNAAERLPADNLTLVGKNTGFNDETTMDIESVHEIAPAAHLVFFNLNSISHATSDADLFALAITQAASRWRGSLISLSLGVCESSTQIFNRSDLVALNSAVASAEARGSTVFASSGDSGGLDCTPPSGDGQPPQSSFEGVLVPASLPSVTSTGGTSITTDAAGNYLGETTWSEPILSQGTGGGVSAYFSRPSWETGVGTGGQTDTNNNFQVPIVSSDSDPATGNFIVENGAAQQGGGTSLAAPTWAGFTALIDQDLRAHHRAPVGFFNPTLFRLANTSVPYPPFHDVTVGGNDFYLATPGYDMTTGLGSPIVYNIARDLLAGRA